MLTKIFKKRFTKNSLLSHYLLYEFVLLFHIRLQSFLYFIFKPEEESRNNFYQQIGFTTKVSPCSLPFTVLIFDDDFLSKLGLRLVVPPEFVSFLSVFCPEEIILQREQLSVVRRDMGCFHAHSDMLVI